MIYLAIGLILAAIFWALVRSNTTGPSNARDDAAPAVLIPTKDWDPPAPTGTPARLSITETLPLEVAGESHQMLAFRRLFAGATGFHNYGGAEFDSVALLAADPNNPHGGGRAVSVWVDGEHVGYIPRDAAPDWFYVCHGMSERGETPAMNCRVWASLDDDQFAARVTLDAPNLNEWKDHGVG